MICAKCNENEIEFKRKKVCGPCYYRERRISNPDKSKLKNRKAYWKRKGNVDYGNKTVSDDFRRVSPIKPRYIRNAERDWVIIKSTPKWLSLELFLGIYENTPDELTRDHIIPLMHKDVCGLNVPWNIQYITLEDNRIKKNSFDGTYENGGWKKFLKK